MKTETGERNPTLPRLTKSMATPKTLTVKLKLRATGEEVEAKIKVMSMTEFAMLYRKIGIKTFSELLQFKDKKFDGLETIDFLEKLSAEVLSVSERWTVNDVRNAFDLQELVKIVTSLNQALVETGTQSSPRRSADKAGVYT